MDCEGFEALISAKLDSEIRPGDAELLREHLANCEDCRSLFDATRAQDREMREAFSDRVRSANELRERLAASFSSMPKRRREPGRLLPLAAALAIGLGVGWLLFSGPPTEVAAPEMARKYAENRPEDASEKSPDEELPDPLATQGRLTYATGAVEMRSPEASTWQPLTAGTRVPIGARLRNDAGCLSELRGADGSTLRLDTSSEVELVSYRTWRLHSGRVDTTVVPAKVPFTVEDGSNRVVALGTRFDVYRSDDLTRVQVFEGATRIESGDTVRVLRRGERASIAEGIRISRLRLEQLATASSWMNALLVREGRADEDLQRRLDELLAGIGQSKMTQLFEQEIRALGTSCVVPLLRYIESPRSESQTRQRHRAARIVSELAEHESIEELIELLTDRDGEVRAAAASALERLTGLDQGLPAASWSSSPWSACETAYLRWLDWKKSRQKI